MERAGSSSDDWSIISVAKEGFLPKRIRDTRFEGACQIGANDGYLETQDGLSLPAGIYSALISNCVIGDNVRISKISGYIHNYHIGEGSSVVGLHLLTADENALCGQGTKAAVLNEMGGREVIVTDQLTAQIAYLMAFYRHDSELQDSLSKAAMDYAQSTVKPYGIIGSHVTIFGTGIIKNARIGDYCRLEGISVIEDATLVSSKEAPSYVGAEVIARHFVMMSGARIADGAQVEHCFVGQACVLGHLFSAHDSIFFANCLMENGESCAVFAGPFTVSMHKSSLLISGFFSFLNAGSGSNQSNHLYKLGPIHQGVVERGSKTTSDSYVLWPAHVGPFTLVMGRHVHHTDSSDFPFSYLIEDNGKTYLVPGINIRSVGTIRDARKWPQRDKRVGKKIDAVNFNLLSPFTVSKMLSGYRIMEHLRDLSQGCSRDHTYTYRDMYIRASSLEKGMDCYRMGIVKFFGNSLITRLYDSPCATDEEVIERLKPDHPVDSTGTWIDLAGLIAPVRSVDGIISLAKKPAATQAMIHEAFIQLHEDYYRLEWGWAYAGMLDWYNIKPEDFTRARAKAIIQEWLEAVVGLDQMLYEDAKKEFQMNVRVGFGVGNKEKREDDFCSVRGTFESNVFVSEVLEHIERKRALGHEMLARLQS